MADQFLDPEQAAPQAGAAPPPGVDSGGLAGAWRGFLQEPSNRAFMLQAGLAMMQPRPVGQSSLGHVANSLSQGGEAASSVQKADERRSEAESVQTARAKSTDARLMGADAALSRAASTEMNANTRSMLAERGGGVTPNAGLQARMRVQGHINRWLQSDPMGLVQDDPYLATLGVASKADALKQYNSDPAFRRRLETLFGGDVGGGPGASGGASGTSATGAPAAGPGTPPPGVPPEARLAPDGHWYTGDQQQGYTKWR